jgi:hypothetical protein
VLHREKVDPAVRGLYHLMLNLLVRITELRWLSSSEERYITRSTGAQRGISDDHHLIQSPLLGGKEIFNETVEKQLLRG